MTTSTDALKTQTPENWYKGHIAAIVDGIAHSSDIDWAKTGHALIFPKEGVRGFILALEPSDAHVGYIGRYRDIAEGAKLSLLPYQMSTYLSVKIVGRVINVVGKDISNATIGLSLSPEYHDIKYNSNSPSMSKPSFMNKPTSIPNFVNKESLTTATNKFNYKRQALVNSSCFNH